MIERLSKLASRDCWIDDEDFNPYDYSLGNFDDAYSGGYSDGQAKLAKEVLEILQGETDNGEDA